MTTKWLVLPALLLLMSGGPMLADDYRVEAFEAAPPDGLAPEIAAKIAETGFKVIKGESRAVCEIWPAKQWEVTEGFTPTAEILYPLTPGTLAGVLRFPRKSSDFRDQDVSRGLYTLRYSNQPVDGNHVGTFETRDFLLMVPADSDTSPEAIEEMNLFETSAEAAGSSHPAIIPLMAADAEGDLPGLDYFDDSDWWALQFAGQGADGKKLVMKLVVVGHSLE
jgi:hypothetical protein